MESNKTHSILFKDRNQILMVISGGFVLKPNNIKSTQTYTFKTHNKVITIFTP